YSLFLSLYRLVSEDLVHLPSVQLALYVMAVILLALAVKQRTGSFSAGFAALLLTIGMTEPAEFPYLMSDTVYATALTAGAAFTLLYFGTLRLSFLLLASSPVGMAFPLRPIGLALFRASC